MILITGTHHVHRVTVFVVFPKRILSNWFIAIIASPLINLLAVERQLLSKCVVGNYAYWLVSARPSYSLAHKRGLVS